MNRIYEVIACPWIARGCKSKYNVCAKSADDARKIIKQQPEITSFLYSDSDIRVKDLKKNPTGWKLNEVRKEN